MEENKDLKKEKRKRNKKLKAGAVAAVTSASVLVGSTFTSPDDLMNQPKDDLKPIIEEYHRKQEDPISSLKQKIRNLIYKVPIAIRMIVFVPLWYLGVTLLSLADTFIQAALTPIASWLLSFLMQTIIILAVLFSSVKLLYPDIPLKKIANKRTIIGALIASILIAVCDIVVPLYWEKYKLYKKMTKMVLGLVAIALIIKPHLIDKWKNRKNNFQIIA